MDLNLITNIKTCLDYKSQIDFGIIYYSHIPTTIISLLVGIFVLTRNRGALLSRLLFIITFSFFAWGILDLVTWIYGYNSVVTMFSWSILAIFNAVLYVASVYFVYVFTDKKDISFLKKIILFLLLIPFIILTPTQFNLSRFNVTDCEAIQNSVLLNYTYFLEVLTIVWVAVLSIFKYFKADKESKKQIALLSIGINLFLFSSFVSGFIADKLDNFNLEQYSLFAMMVFLVFLGYLIVKFKAFDIKLLGTQALLVALVVLIGAQFFFTPLENTTNIVLISVTLFAAIVMGWFLIKSVKLEVQRKEQLQQMSDKLSSANDQLRKLDNAKTEFISIASHQLRTPLTAIKGFVSLLLEGTYGEINIEAKEALNKVYYSAENLVNLVENLLNISRMESGRMEYNFQPYHIETTLHELFDTFTIIAKNKGMYIHMKLPDEPLPEFSADGQKIREVISNLIDNAFKYTKKGGVTVKAELVDSKFQTSGVDNKSIRVTVSDTGIGIPQDELPYLFAKFSRGKDINRLNTGGTGLGIYVAKNIVEAHGGKVWAESDGVDKGSRFIVELPVKPI